VQDYSIPYKNSNINYRCSGRGPETLICFHGYAEEAGVFDFLARYAGHLFTIYSIDLPFHGKTDWKEGLLFTPDDLLNIVNGILTRDDKGYLASSAAYMLLGFSLGGRMALSLYEAKPEAVKKLVLLAPDGLKINFWYWLATQTWAGNKLFAVTMKRPGWFFWLLKLMNKFGLINASIFKFVNYYIGNKEVRDLLYVRWTALRKVKPRLRTCKSFIRERNTPVRLVYGKHDRIILSSVGEKFRKGIEQQCTLSVIPSGHQVLHEKHAEDILQSLIR
jgi:pimeloyl-ACP methyl ester carboxylesterase